MEIKVLQCLPISLPTLNVATMVATLSKSVPFSEVSMVTRLGLGYCSFLLHFYCGDCEARVIFLLSQAGLIASGGRAADRVLSGFSVREKS